MEFFVTVIPVRGLASYDTTFNPPSPIWKEMPKPNQEYDCCLPFV